MNPSYSSGPTNSGGQPGMVASGPDSNVPQGVDGGGSSGGFNFNNFLNNVPKKWLAIGAGALVVILIVVVVVMGMGGKKNDGGNGGNSRPTTTFNRLINYVTSGKESDAEVKDAYSVTADYYFLNGWKDENEKKTVYSKTKELVDNFANNYKNASNENANNAAKNIKEVFDFIYLLNSKDRIYGKDIREKIEKEGKTSAKKFALDYYDVSSLGDNSYAAGFSEAYTNWVKAIFTDSKDTSDLYKEVVTYFDMSEKFVANIYNVNTLLFDKSLTGEGDAKN